MRYYVLLVYYYYLLLLVLCTTVYYYVLLCTDYVLLYVIGPVNVKPTNQLDLELVTERL